VADQGEGIAPEHLNRLFEKFFRIKSGLGRHVVGTGLGLPIARTIVETHGGRIWAESQLGQGTTFFFTILRTAPIPPRWRKEWVMHQSHDDIAWLDGRVLVVDDEPSGDWLQILKRLATRYWRPQR
jgi:hypothetical protein